MNISETEIILIEDNQGILDGPLTIYIEESFSTLKIFEDPLKGIEYIKNNIHKDIIVILDLDFPSGSPNGQEVINKIREISSITPVIIYSAMNEIEQPFSALINNHAFAFIKKSQDDEELLKALRKADIELKNNVANALKKWIFTHKEQERDEPYLITLDGKQLSLNEILKEVINETSIGKQFSKQLMNLTIDLLSRDKEQLND